MTLPTFILEKRSLLEMYSDFLGHAELFIAIPGGITARERMVRVLKYYLTSFHCGRKGGEVLEETAPNFLKILNECTDSQTNKLLYLVWCFPGHLAKKPYNPIVGETFQCSYYVSKSIDLGSRFQQKLEPDDMPTDAPDGKTHYRIRYASEQVSLGIAPMAVVRL